MPLPRVLFAKILVQRDEAETKVGSIVLSNDAVSVKNTGTVLAVGEGLLVTGFPGDDLSLSSVTSREPREAQCCHVEPHRVKVGDHIVFSNFVQTTIIHEGVPLLVMDGFEDVIAILD